MNAPAIRPLKDILAVMEGKSDADKALVEKAYEFSKTAHEPQKRYSGEPYFVHPAEVGFLLAQAGMDAQAIAAGLLHDTIEDAGVSAKKLEEEFGQEVLTLVQGVTKLGTLRYRGLERHTESLRKLFAATADDIRVLIIKLMDRLHNARTLEHVPEEKRKRIALETLEIYAPIADRLGMSVAKQELEDAAFPHAYPRRYEKTRQVMKERRYENEERMKKVERALKRVLAEAGLRKFRTEARIKGSYSLYQKLERKDWDIAKIHDILALRVIFPSVADCYSALGVIHGQWRPVPGKIKDYIAFPKPNGYQSIHTTVYTGDGGALEVQLRTEAQHREALYGIASHLTYKEDQAKTPAGKRGGLEWVRQFFPKLRRGATPMPANGRSAPEWVQELAHAHQVSAESEEYLDTLKSDFFSHRVFVFTPKGDVIDLPIEATPIDFAYAVHSQLGNTMSGARVNGKMVSLDSALHNGDVVEVITKPSAKPSRKWHDIAKTSMAKKHIRAAVAAAEAVAQGGSAASRKKS